MADEYLKSYHGLAPIEKGECLGALKEVILQFFFISTYHNVNVAISLKRVIRHTYSKV